MKTKSKRQKTEEKTVSDKGSLIKDKTNIDKLTCAYKF